MSVVMVACNNVTAQTIDTITEQRKAFENNPQIMVGSQPVSIAVNEITNKIYVTNLKSGTVSVIDSNSGSRAKEIHVGEAPYYITVDSDHNKIYVANFDSYTVSIIDGNNDTEIGQISVGHRPGHILVLGSKIYVANPGNNTVSVIDVSHDRKERHDIVVRDSPQYIAFDYLRNKIYVANADNNTVSVIHFFHFFHDKKEGHLLHDIPVGNHPFSITGPVADDKFYVANIDHTIGSLSNITANNTVSVINGNNDTKIGQISVEEPSDMARLEYLLPDYRNKIYVANAGNNTVSVINTTNDMKEPDIRVGENPRHIAVNSVTHMIYVANSDSNTVSVIDGFSDKVAAGITLNTHPANSGTIMCDKKEYPTNIYLYIDVGTNCKAQPNKDFEFSGWVENLNRNSTIPLGASSGNLTVNRYGTFTANFIPIPPAIPPAFLYLLVGIILSSLFGWSIPSIAGWYKARKQLEHLEECINQIGKLDKNAIENKIKGYYVQGKISEDHRQFLKDKISEYYENVEGS